MPKPSGSSKNASGKSQKANRRANKQSATTRYSAPVLLFALVIAAAIIGLVVYFTPLADLPEDPNAVDPNATDPALNGGTLAQTAEQALAAVPENPIVLPAQPAGVNVGKLQDRLEKLAQQQIDGYPNESGSYHYAAQIYSELKQTEKAQAAWRKSVELKPKFAGPYVGLAQLLIAAGQETEATTLLIQMSELGIDSAEVPLQLAAALEQGGNIESAGRVTAEAVSQYPADAELWESHARIQNQLQNFEAAESAINQSIELAGDSESRLALLATALARQRKTKQAIAARDRLTAMRSSQTPQEDGFQGVYESALREIAIHAFQSAATLAEVHENYSEAEERLLEALELAPNNTQTLMSLATMLRRQRRQHDALTIHQRLVELQPQNILNFTNLASLALQMGDAPLAESTLLSAAELDPTGVIAQASLARLYMAQGRFPQATTMAAHVIEHNKSVESYVLFARVCDASGNRQAGELALEKARSIDPNHPLLSP